MNDAIREHDTPWKEIIESLFPRFIEFFFPDAYAEIDWNRAPAFMDKELQQVARGSSTGRRYVDKLVKVWTTGGEEAWVLIHIEVQGQRDKGFPKRMFVYHYRLFDRYASLVASFVVLADDDRNWRPDEYRHSLWGVEAGLKFRTAKLADYWERWEELEKSRNPFAAVVMAHLKSQETNRNEAQRLRSKIILAKMMYRRGYKRREVLELFRFIDYVLALPEELELEYERELAEFEEGQKVTYLSRFERRGMQRGLEQGIAQGLEQGQIASARAAIVEVLATRFEKVPNKVAGQLNKIGDANTLRGLLRKAVKASTLKEFERQLNP
jgi:hypothetical protein